VLLVVVMVGETETHLADQLVAMMVEELVVHLVEKKDGWKVVYLVE
jgi:hypothetical protein